MARDSPTRRVEITTSFLHPQDPPCAIDLIPKHREDAHPGLSVSGQTETGKDQTKADCIDVVIVEVSA